MAPNRESREQALLDRAAVVLRDSVADRTQVPVAVDLRRASRDQQWPALEKLARVSDWGQAQIGDMPPQPPTWRARIGAVFVRIVRRALFWYTQQIVTFQRLVSNAAREQVQACEQFAAEHQRHHSVMTALNARVERLDQQYWDAIRTLSARAERLDQQLAVLQAESRQAERQDEINASLEQLGGEMKRLDRLVHESRVFMLQQSLRVTVLLKELRGRPGTADAAPALTDGDSELADLTQQHADCFRGSCDDIRERLRVYLPEVRSAVSATSDSPVLDLGCGRGEWLELLLEHHITARGVDGSPSMVRACLEKRLDVVQSDVIKFMRGVPDQSLSVVTAFHLLEHLEWNDLVEVIDQTVRVLKPGGVAIFETPNPRNLQVASYNFYVDPTHVRPLPSELLSFLVEARGLCQPETLPLHPYPKSFQLESGDRASDFLNQVFFGPQDYAIIAKRV